MKKIFRMIVFSGAAVFLTALWDKGFVIKSDPLIYLKAALVIAAVYYLIVPMTKFILLPLNILSLGLVSVVVYAGIFYLLLNRFHLITIKGWMFPGLKFFRIVLAGTKISFIANIFISSLSISTIINLLEAIL